MDRLTRWLLRLATVVAVSIGLWVVFRGVRVSAVAATLRSARLGPLTARALALLSLGFVARAGRFRAVIGDTRVRFRDIVATVLLTQGANNVLPLHAGEIVKTRDFVAAGYPLRRVVVAQGIEKLFEAGSMAVICAPAMALAFRWGTRWVEATVVIGAVFCALVALGARRAGSSAEGIARVWAWSFGADAIEIALVGVTLDALGIALGLGDWLAVLGAVNLAIALPSTPAHAGAIEAGAALGLIAVGVGHDDAVAFAVLYRVVQWLPVTVAGGLIWAWRVAGRRVCARAASLTRAARRS
jgi:hypothetical protein